MSKPTSMRRIRSAIRCSEYVSQIKEEYEGYIERKIKRTQRTLKKLSEMTEAQLCEFDEIKEGYKKRKRCDICDVKTKNKCKKCKKIYYCSPEHEEEGKDFHDAECKYLKCLF